MLDRERLTEDLPPAGACVVVGFVGCLTAFAGFCFVFGILFTLVVVVFGVWALLIGVPQNGNPLVFFAIVIPMMIAYEYVSWRFFWFGWRVLRGDPRRDDSFDPDGKPRRPQSEAE